MSFFDLFLQSLPFFLKGMGVTLQMTFFALLIAIVLGMLICFFRISSLKILNIISTVYVDIIRGTPLLAQAFFLYFGLTSALGFQISNKNAGIIVLALNAGAYLSEIFRSGINAVSHGQMEAARSLGLPYSKSMSKVILPQAIRIVIPSIMNQFIITLKDTTIISVIGAPELIKAANVVSARTFRSFEVYAMIAILYFIVIFTLTKISTYIERRLAIGKGKR